MAEGRPRTPPFPLVDVTGGKRKGERKRLLSEYDSPTSDVEDIVEKNHVETLETPAPTPGLIDGVSKCKEDETPEEEDHAPLVASAKTEPTLFVIRPSTLGIKKNKESRISQILQGDTDSATSSDDDTRITNGPAKVVKPLPTSTLPYRPFPQAWRNVQQTSTEKDPLRNEDTISVRELSAILTPEVLSGVKEKLRRSTSQINRQYSTYSVRRPLSPAAEWEQRRKKVKLNKPQATRIKAGWKVRQCLAHLPENASAETLFHRFVRDNLEKEVHALFAIGKGDPRYIFDRDYRNEHNKSALRIALDDRNTPMLKILLNYNLKHGDCLFHAIKHNYIDGTKEILFHKPSTNAEIVGENYYFQPGMKPMILAAQNNNYRLLSILYDYDHRLPELRDWIEGIHTAWESSNERRMLCLARASPAYITLMHEKNHIDPFRYCLKEIKRIRQYRRLEHEFSEFYEEVIIGLERFMCGLLDQIQSSYELAGLFGYDYIPMYNPKSKLPLMIDGSAARTTVGVRLQLLEEAAFERLMNFVTHQQSQLALSYLRYRSVPFIRQQGPFVRNLITMSIGSMYPILCLLYVLFPKSKVGTLLTLPIISFSCHMMADIFFVLLLIVNILIKQTEDDYLGAPPSTIQILILIWVCGKWIQEAQECINRGPRNYFYDYWNYNDIIQLTLFTTAIVLRIVDVSLHAHCGSDDHSHLLRSEWSAYEPRLIAEAVQAFAYIFVFLRLLGIARADRMLGPLQISLARMLTDIFRFLGIFALVLFAFAFGLSELYWYYGTTEGIAMFCKNDTQEVTNSTTKTVCESSVHTVFTSPLHAIKDLFWALFGYIELSDLNLGGRHVFTEYVGILLTAVYHVVAIIVLLNMLIAMMSNSYEKTSSNEETEWKFHRTSMWIRYIRREVIRPPPMNLFPNPYRLKENFKRLRGFFRGVWKCCTKPCRNCMKSSCAGCGGSSKEKVNLQMAYRYSVDSVFSSVTDESDMVDGICCGSRRKKAPKGGKPTKPPLRTSAVSLVQSPPANHQFDLESTSLMGSRNSSNATVEIASSPQNFHHALPSKARKKIRAVIRLDIAKQEHKSLLSKFVRRYKYKHLIDPQ